MTGMWIRLWIKISIHMYTRCLVNLAYTIQFCTLSPMGPLCPSVLQVVGAALDAAKHRRDRLVTFKDLVLTPARVGDKRVLNKGRDHDPSSASTAASSVVPVEKVTPDPKHLRVGPSPKTLYFPPADAENTLQGELGS